MDLTEVLITKPNMLIMGTISLIMFIFRTGPGLKKIAGTKWGKAAAYYIPFLLGVLAQMLPVGLAAEGSSLGHKMLLGLLLGGASSKVWDSLVSGPKHLFGK